MANSFYDDPRRVQYDKNRTEKKRLEKLFFLCFLFMAVPAVILGFLAISTGILAFAAGHRADLFVNLLTIPGVICGILGIHAKSYALSFVSIACYAVLTVLNGPYFLLYAGVMAAAAVLIGKWKQLEQQEGFPHFNFREIEDQERDALERNTRAAVIGTSGDLTARAVYVPEAQPAPQAVVRPSGRADEMDSV